jgi:hypothetical protein
MADTDDFLMGTVEIKDSDGDGVSDGQERLDGTDPDDATSYAAPELDAKLEENPETTLEYDRLEAQTMVDKDALAPDGVTIDSGLTNLDGRTVDLDPDHGDVDGSGFDVDTNRLDPLGMTTQSTGGGGRGAAPDLAPGREPGLVGFDGDDEPWPDPLPDDPPPDDKPEPMPPFPDDSGEKPDPLPPPPDDYTDGEGSIGGGPLVDVETVLAARQGNIDFGEEGVPRYEGDAPPADNPYGPIGYDDGSDAGVGTTPVAPPTSFGTAGPEVGPGVDSAYQDSSLVSGPGTQTEDDIYIGQHLGGTPVDTFDGSGMTSFEDASLRTTELNPIGAGDEGDGGGEDDGMPDFG